MIAARHPLFARFAAANARLRGGDPAADLDGFVALLSARDALLGALDLPATAYNLATLCAAAERGDGLDAWLAIADRHLPPLVLDDEALLLATLASYFHQRGVTDWVSRLYDVEAFLGALHHPHNLGAIGAWLRGHLPFVTMRAALSDDPLLLASSIQ
jgi:hypothetical protein